MTTDRIKLNAVLMVVLVVFTLLCIGASATVRAAPLSNEAYAKHEAACYIFGVAAGALDVYGGVNAKHYGSYVEARKQAGVHMYKTFNCTTVEST